MRAVALAPVCLTPSDRRRLALDHVAWVGTIARRIGGAGWPDLVGPGMVGLYDALDRFDPAAGTTFSSYAEHFVRGAMLRARRRDRVAVGSSARLSGEWLDGVVAASRECDEVEAVEFAVAWHLTARQAAVIRLRFGFDGETSLTLAATGERLGLDRRTVGRIEATALGRLRRALGEVVVG